MNPYVFTYIMFFLQGLLESYFLCNYLYTDNFRKSFVISQILLCTLQHPVQMLLFDIQGIKMIFYILVLYIIVFVCFPRNNIKKKLFSVLLMMLLISFVEVIAVFIEVITVGMPEMLSLENPHPLHVYLLQLIFMYITFTIALHLINKQMMLNKKNMVLFVILCVLQFVYLFLLTVSITMNIVHLTKEILYLAYLVLLIVAILIYSFVLVYIIKKHQKHKEEVILLMLQKEYEDQLQHYMKQKNTQTNISMLRHDLINYIQSQKYIE